MRLGYRLWLESGGKAFGSGPFELLSLVESTGSIRSAALKMGMSYSKAWHIISTAEAKLGFPLLERTVGGATGGGSILTPTARDLLRRYADLSAETAVVLDDLYSRHFDGFMAAPSSDPSARAVSDSALDARPGPSGEGTVGGR